VATFVHHDPHPSVTPVPPCSVVLRWRLPTFSRCLKARPPPVPNGFSPAPSYSIAEPTRHEPSRFNRDKSQRTHGRSDPTAVARCLG
jgi:hypothetical protein